MSSQSQLSPTSISVDLKKYRIRIFKNTIHLLGDPKHIQLLVSPSKMEVAIRAVESELPAAQTHKVNQHQMNSDNSFEIYSRTFVLKLCEVVGQLETTGTYRISGEVLPKQKVAVYSLKTIKKVEI